MEPAAAGLRHLTGKARTGTDREDEPPHGDAQGSHGQEIDVSRRAVNSHGGDSCEFWDGWRWLAMEKVGRTED
jgi:hypothetical protein